MNKHKILGLIGGGFAFAYALYRIYHSIRISLGFPFGIFISELGIDLFVIAVFFSPAIVLYYTECFKKNIIWLAWSYIIVLLFTFVIIIYNDLVTNDPIAVGLPILLFVFPALIIISTVLFFLRKKNIVNCEE